MTNREQRPCPGKLLGAAALALVLGTTAPTRSDPPRLPWEAQEQVNIAIDRGVVFLRQTQTRYPQGHYGTWARKDNHKVGYTALPGLTLLECGVPAKDDAVVRAANFVRGHAGKVEHTYDIALAILFLDRLGNPKDKALIQRLALRLVAGQGPTGGWGYKCPLLDTDTHKQLLTILGQLEPPVLFNPMNTPRPGLSEPIAGLGPGTGDPLAPPAPGSPGTQYPLAGTPPGGKPEPLYTPVSGNSPNSPVRSPGEQSAVQPSPGPAPAAGGLVAGGPPAADPGGDGSAGAGPERTFRRWGWCLKMQEEPPEPAPRKSPPPRKPPKSLLIPPQLTGLPVLYDARTLPLIEPKDQENVPVFGRTDNSNTQFALLALWAARRHGVPATRSLNLLTRRFLTSQNGDGSWGYLYKFGGNEPERPPMTCVGLLGLAVGYGLAHEAGAAPKGFVQDPRIVQGFAALNKNIGTPTGRMQGHAMKNLYFLWSVERVGVLYNIATIGGKDWYRWGAEILVANQQPAGNWQNGGYHGADATIDTCLALLFLKRANLATDLAGRLPFNAAQLQESITESLKPRAPPAAPPRAADSDKGKEPPASAASPGTTPDPIAAPPAPPPSPPAPAPVRRGAGEQAEPTEAVAEDGSAWLVWLLVLLAFLLLGAGLLVVLLHRREHEEEKQPSRKRRKGRMSKKTVT